MLPLYIFNITPFVILMKTPIVYFRRKSGTKDVCKAIMKPIIAISLGDPAGIGPEITVSSLDAAQKICTPILFGHFATFEQICTIMDYPMENICLTNQVRHEEARVQFVDTKGPMHSIQKPGMEAAQAQLAALSKATDAVLAGECDALTTAPVSKELIAQIEPDFTGHTEYLAKRCNLNKDDVTMVFATRDVVIGLISTHIPLAKIPATINEKTYSRTLHHVIDIVRRNTGTATPKIAVAALNPHAGESGLLGKEEIDFLVPFCRSHNGLNNAQLFGPIPADSVFRDAFSGKYHGVISAYHDQALIPLKLSGFGGSTNVTAGLPFIRTSPDHGTAYDLARKNLADASAMRTAIRMAVHLAVGVSKRPRSI